MPKFREMAKLAVAQTQAPPSQPPLSPLSTRVTDSQHYAPLQVDDETSSLSPQSELRSQQAQPALKYEVADTDDSVELGSSFVVPSGVHLTGTICV